MAREKEPFEKKEKKNAQKEQVEKEGPAEETTEADKTQETKKKKDKKRREKRGKKPLSPDAPLHQIMPIVMTALAAFFGVCLYTKLEMGFLGQLIANVCFGLFGIGTYIIPVLLLLSALRWHASAQNRTLVRNHIFYFIIIFLASVLGYTFGMPKEHLASVGSFYAIGQAQHLGGGFLGGIAGYALEMAVSKVGTIIFVIALLVVFLVLGFGIRFKDLFMRVVRYFAAKAAEAKEKRQHAEEARVAEEVERRKEKIHAESNFYDATTISVPGGTTPSSTAQAKAASDSDSRRGDLPKPVVRRFYDADAEASTDTEPVSASEDRMTAPTSVTPPVTQTPAKVHRPFYDVDTEPVSEEAAIEQLKQTSADKTDALRDKKTVLEDDSLEIQIVASRPIPANRTVPFGTEKPVKEEPIPEREAQTVAEPSVAVASDMSSPETENTTAPSDEPDSPSLVINKAHVVEHIGAETLGDGDEKKYANDTFFYSFPPLSLLREDDTFNKEDSDQEIQAKADKLKATFDAFSVAANITSITRGPRLTRYEVVPSAGVRISKVENLVDEITMNLEAISVRIEAPIPGKAAIGVEVPNIHTTTVRLRGLLDTDTFRDAPGKTTVCLGVDVVGVPVYADLDKMPHLLVAGATGMGKSVCINSILVSLLYKARPDEVKLILIDPKKVEFQAYANIPHLLVPVVTEPQKAAGALAWAVSEMERRYDLIESAGVRNIVSYNKTVADHPGRTRLPQIVVVIDELHDLMIQARDAVEDSIARIAAKARAAGILLIIGTQRPSVNVITGVIKANIPSRIAFHVASQVDSRTILDAVGAEKLLNNGDMLFLSPGMKMMTPKRIQGAFLDDDEVARVTEYLRKNSSAVQYDETIMYDMERESERYNKDKKSAEGGSDEDEPFDGSEDEIFYRAVEIALENGKIATSLLQRRLKVGYGKAARIIDRMFDMGIVGPPNGQKPRDVLISNDEYHAMRLRNDE